MNVLVMKEMIIGVFHYEGSNESQSSDEIQSNLAAKQPLIIKTLSDRLDKPIR